MFYSCVFKVSIGKGIVNHSIEREREKKVSARGRLGDRKENRTLVEGSDTGEETDAPTLPEAQS